MRRHYFLDPEMPAIESTAWEPRLLDAGWSRTESESWDLYWALGLPAPLFYSRLEPHQSVNRLPGVGAYAVKSHLCRNLVATQSWTEDLEPVHPRTFLMPDDYHAWSQAADKEPDQLWLIKPKASSCGRGIAIVIDHEAVPRGDDWMVQEYLRPHLLDGHKYGLRCYLLITSLDPLLCYWHAVGTCKFATRPYTEAAESLADPFVHVINTTVQQRNQEVAWSARNTDLQAYRQRLRNDNVDDHRLFARLRDALIRVAIAGREEALIEGRDSTPHGAGLFELMSVDVQVDRELKPWVLECNPGPPMGVEPGYEGDAAEMFGRTKQAVMADTLSVIGAGRVEAMPNGKGDEHYWQRRAERELAAADGWRRLWPDSDADRFGGQFPLLRPLDQVLVSLACPAVSAELPQPSPSPAVTTRQLGDGIALHDGNQGRLYTLNPLAAGIWFGIGDGLTPDQLTKEIAAGLAGSSLSWEEDELWDLLVAWAQRGLLSGFERAPTRDLWVAESLTLEALDLGGLLVIATEGLDRSGLGVFEPRVLPHPEAGRLALAAPGTGSRARLAVGHSAAALDAIGREFGDLVLDAQAAMALVDWLNGLDIYLLEVPPGTADEAMQLLALATGMMAICPTNQETRIDASS